LKRYVLITPAHNEAALIEKTIASVTAQTVLPLKWVIVNDASTDDTRKVVERHVKEHGFIQLLNVERAAGRHFGNKVRAFNLGAAQVAGLQFDFIGNLDADISFAPDYFEQLLGRFDESSHLGIGGGMVHTLIDGNFVSQEVALDSVAGAVQLFRWKCYEQVGGYRPLPEGGIDAAAEIAARMHSWSTRTFPELRVNEHRLTGSATARPLASRVKEGRRMHSLGYSPLFFLVRCLYRSLERPMVVGSIAALYGYARASLKRNPTALPREMVRFLRSEQHNKLKRLLRLKTA
jgi:glycosyltransferase involved in cell wall biosynthesis